MLLWLFGVSPFSDIDMITTNTSMGLAIYIIIYKYLGILYIWEKLTWSIRIRVKNWNSMRPPDMINPVTIHVRDAHFPTIYFPQKVTLKSVNYRKTEENSMICKRRFLTSLTDFIFKMEETSWPCNVYFWTDYLWNTYCV